ncbi:3-oxoacyl-[acyl-carrier-protein] synthase III C-terminal domain-containing protein [Microbaculum marinum]|uniref:3-oxoacyl-[acyl-carrier-protein] synthase III C-terminal domain-containing protein n=1 Tax=Microbaculum marinum TaxID=1764581 RepID=A0AAW9RFP9_9HYPH
MTGIAAIGTYLPRARLERSSIAEAVGWLAPGLARSASGQRTLAFWDEDSTTMAVAAARDCLSGSAGRDAGDRIASLAFATTTPAFAERQNASVVHGALRLPPDCIAQDVTGTPRGALVTLHMALEAASAALVVAADRPVSRAGSADEMQLADGGAAVLTGAGPGLLAYLGGASLTSPFADRYRRTGSDFATVWEERWVREEGILKLVPDAIARALGRAGVGAGDIDLFVFPGTIRGIGSAVAKKAGLGNARIADTLAARCGDTGTGHALLMLAAAMEEIEPGERILLAQFGQGATALVFEATEAIAERRPAVSAQLDAGIPERHYLKLPVFCGLLPWEKGLRGRGGVNEALSVAHRYNDALLGFVGGRCRETGAVQFPPSRISANPQAPLADTQDPYPLADRLGRIASVTADGLAFSHQPPACYGLVDFDGGGRLMMEFTDPDAQAMRIGDAVRFVFRIKDVDEQNAYLRYFWKAVPASAASRAATDEADRRSA